MSASSQTSNEAREMTMPDIDFKTGAGIDIDKNLENKTNSNMEIFTVVEEPPQFPGGLVELNSYVEKNLVYPKTSAEKKISGKCFLKFIICSDGKIANPQILKGVPNCEECDNEALHLVKSMPNWIPAKMKGKNVSAYFNLPISFKSNS